MISEIDRREFLAAMTALTAISFFPKQSLAGKVEDRLQPTPDQVEYGADYYAEDWPSERVETDAKLMQQAHFRTVRIADTNWERL